ncbi:MAG: hypothetical protein WCT16_01800 [Candidatus Buchananbacteria bacterium]
MIAQCCVCHKVRLSGNVWVGQFIPPGEQVSHGYCPECAAQAREGMQRELAVDRQRREPANGNGEKK